MAKHPKMPTREELVDYQHAVAGHDGTLSDADGMLFIKPCVAKEIAFYEDSAASHPDFAEYMPTFLGVLTLDEGMNGAATIEEAGAALLAQHTSPSEAVATPPTNGGPPPSAEASTIAPEPTRSKVVGKRISTNRAVVLENAAYGFKKPNILDVKLGIRLYADDAKPEKKARFDKVSDETTHKKLGFRIAGMRVWQGENAPGEEVDAEGYKIYDKNYGRLFVTTDNIEDAFRKFITAPSAGVDAELGKILAQAFLVDVERILEVMETQESRMFSASLLFVYEGDGKALRAAMEAASAPPVAVNGDAASEEDEDEPELPKIYTVKVIDFAHAVYTPGEGPDENSLVGIRSVAKLWKTIGA